MALTYREGEQAFGAFMAGAWIEAKDHAEKGIAHTKKQGGGWWELALLHQVVVWSLFYLGELEELASRAVPLAQEALDRGDLFAASGMILGRPNLIYLRLDDPTRARQKINEIIQRWSTTRYLMQHYQTMFANAHIDLYLGEGMQAHRRVCQEWPKLKRSLLMVLPSVKYEAFHLRGRVTLARATEAETSERKRLLAQVSKDARRLSRRKLAWTSALSLLLQAGVAAQRGEGGDVAGKLESVIAALDAADMRLYAAAARRRLGSLLGGDEGAAHLAAGNDYMAQQGVKDPERMTAILAPGLLK
jgi:hypothetical protein